MLPIFKVERVKDYVVMSNYHLRDKNLSLKAKGLLSWMLSNDERWDYTVAGIASVMKESRDAINSALCELEDCGYLVRKQLRSGGKFGDMEYIISEKPQSVNTGNGNKAIIQDVDTKQEISSPKNNITYAEIFSNPKYKVIVESLRNFLDYCKGMRYTPKAVTVEKWAEFLTENAGDNPEIAMNIVNQSKDRGWKDLYKLKGEWKTGKKKGDNIKRIPYNPENLAKDENGNYIVY